jgi:hypothetical protein
MKRVVFIGLVLCLMLVPGCKTANSQKDYDITPDNLTVADLPEAKSIVIEFASKDSIPITAVLVKTEDATKALDALRDTKSKKEMSIEQAVGSVKALAQQSGTKGTITAPTTDSKTAYSLLMYSKKKTTVTMTTKGK